MTVEKWKHFDDCPRISDRNYRWLGLIAPLSRTGRGSQKWGAELILKGHLRKKAFPSNTTKHFREGTMVQIWSPWYLWVPPALLSIRQGHYTLWRGSLLSLGHPIWQKVRNRTRIDSAGCQKIFLYSLPFGVDIVKGSVSIKANTYCQTNLFHSNLLKRFCYISCFILVFARKSFSIHCRLKLM